MDDAEKEQQTACTPEFAAGEEHQALGALVGEWAGTTRTWFEPDVLADESPWQGTITPLLDGRFVMHEYRGSMQGKPLRGLAILGYDRTRRRYETAWIDSFHTGTAIMFSTGEPDGEGMKMLVSYPDPTGGPDWGWRTEVELKGPDELVITAFNIMPGGEEARAVETSYRRTR